MATEPADVLIIGAGASGGVVALRLAQAGFKVVCLEQGGWLDRADYPGNKLDWELKARKDWATSPNIRGLAQDYPIVEDDTPGLAADVQRGRRLDDHLRGRLAARAAVRLPRPLARRRSPTTGRSTTSSCCRTSIGPTASSACPGLPGDPAYPPDSRGRADAAAPDRGGRAEGRARARPSSAGTGGPSSTRSTRSPTTAAGRASSGAPASRAATRAPRRRPT